MVAQVDPGPDPIVMGGFDLEGVSLPAQAVLGAAPAQPRIGAPAASNSSCGR